MEYFNVYDQNYVRLAKNEGKYLMYKIEVLDHLEYVIYDISDDIIVNSVNVSISYAQGVQGKLSFEIFNQDHKYDTNMNSPFWFGNKLQIHVGLKDNTSGDIYWFSKGVYAVYGLSHDMDIISVTAVDKFGILTSEMGGACLENATKIELGSKIGKMFVDMLAQDRGNGTSTDPIPPLIDFDTMDIDVGEDLELSTGAFFGDVFSGLANSLRCRIYYDNHGHLVLTRGSSDFEFKDKAPMWVFDDDVTAEFISASVEYNFPEVKNRVTVWGEDFEGVSYIAVATNDNPKSPVAVSKVGYRVAKTIEDMYGYEQQNVDSYAQALLKMKSIIGLSTKIDCTTLPHLNVEDVVLVRDKKLALDEQRFMISEITYNGSTMNLSLTNIDHLPDYEEF